MIRFAASTPLHCSKDAYEQFLSAVTQLDSTESLLRAACAISQHAFDDQRLSDVMSQLRGLADRVRARAVDASPAHRIAALHHVLFDEEGFIGATMSAPIFSYLPQVLALKQGAPEALCLIYSLVAERVELRAESLRLPRGFCIRVPCGDGHHYVDVARGRSMSRDESHRARLESQMPGCGEVGYEQWLQALLRNVQTSFARGDNQEDLEAMLELQRLLECVAC